MDDGDFKFQTRILEKEILDFIEQASKEKSYISSEFYYDSK